MIFECCVGNFKDAILGEKNGAHRIELCDNLQEGGTTPSYGTIKMAKEKLSIPTMVIIRPRGGDFYFSNDEIEIMKKDVEICREIGVYGIVIGALTRDNKVDVQTIKELKAVAGNLKTTYHMAFNEIEDKREAIDCLVDLGVDRILTSGNNNPAFESKELLRDLIEYAGDRIIIIPGAGITKDNRDEMIEFTGCTEIHGTKIV